MRARASRRNVLAAAAGCVLAAAILAVVSEAAPRVAKCDGRAVTITAEPGKITKGTNGDDVILGTNGDDDIRARDGNDRVCTGKGDDRVGGGDGDGDDRINLGAGNDLAFGVDGNDKISAMSSARTRVDQTSAPPTTSEELERSRPGAEPRCAGGRGHDTLYGKNGADKLEGNRGSDELLGGNGRDTCVGGKGRDSLTSCNESSSADGPGPGTDPDPCVGAGCDGPGNILLLIADDLGIESSICYTDGAGSSPRLASLCEQAVIFDDVWSSPTCSPTRSGILTGRHGFRTGIGEQATNANGLQLGADEWTLPRILDAANSGYSHASFGKWHLGGDADYPNEMGWSHFSGLLQGAFGDYEDWTKTTNGTTAQVSTYATTEIVDDALAWIGAQSSPWFAWVAFNAPHTPFHLPPGNLHTASLSGSAADIAANPDAYYAAAIEALDTEIGRLLDTIPSDELARTTVIFIGDNGSPARVSSHSQGRSKGSLHEGGLHVPMMIWGHGVEAGGRRSAALAGTIDLHATVLEHAGVDSSSVVPATVTVDANSLVPVLDNTAPDGGSDVVLAELFGTVSRANRQGRAIRNDRYKLIELSSGGVEFYDLLADRRGETPLGSRTAAEQAAFDELSAQLDAWVTAAP